MGRNSDRGNHKQRERDKRRATIHRLREKEFDSEARAERKAALASVVRGCKTQCERDLSQEVTQVPQETPVQMGLMRRLLNSILFWRK